MSSERQVRCPACGHPWGVPVGDTPLTRATCPECDATVWVGPTAPPRRSLRFFWARVGLQFLLTVAVLAAGLSALAAGRTALAVLAIGSAAVFAVLERDDYAMAASVLRERHRAGDE